MNRTRILAAVAALVGAGMIGGLTAPMLASAGSDGLLFQPVEPYRALDTRNEGTAVPAAGTWIVELPAGVRGAAVTVTITGAQADGYVTVAPDDGRDGPLTTTVSFDEGATMSGSTIVGAAGAAFGGGEIVGSIEIRTSAPTHVIVDVTGHLVSD